MKSNHPQTGSATPPGLPHPVSLCTPAVRMVVVTAWPREAPDEPGGWTTAVQILPVLAISARATEDGGVEHDALIVSPDPVWGIQPADCLGSYECAFQLAAAPWPEEQDAERLASLIVDLENRALREAGERLEIQARRELARPTPVENL